MAKRTVENSEQRNNAHFNYQRKVNDVMQLMLVLDNIQTLELHPDIRKHFEVAKQFRQKWLDMPLYVEVDE